MTMETTAAAQRKRPKTIERAWFDEWLSIPRLVQWQGVIADVAKQMDFALRVLNNGEHWEFKSAGCLIEWWPSTGTLMIDKKKERKAYKTFKPVMFWIMRRSGQKAKP